MAATLCAFVWSIVQLSGLKAEDHAVFLVACLFDYRACSVFIRINR